MIFLAQKSNNVREWKHRRKKAMNQRKKHKEQIRNAILEVASEIIITEGIENLTIRKIAAAIDYSIPTVYEYFLNKEALVHELQKEWLKKMQEVIQIIHAQEDNSILALEKIAEAYFYYAQMKPAFYSAVMGLDRGSMDQSPSYPELHTIRTILKEILYQAKSDVLSSQEELENRVDLLRCILHGVVSLMLVNKIKGGEARAFDLMKQAIKNLID
jgi:AcrR family transcriptional regulator